MAFIDWKEGLSTGFDAIDTQHKRLIELINAYMAAHARGLDQKALVPLLTELRDYTKRHFSDEEEFMRKMRFPALSEHQTLHMQLTSKVKQYQDMVYRHQPIDAREFGDFLKNWLIQHILYKDMEYAKYKREKDAEALASQAPVEDPAKDAGGR